MKIWSTTLVVLCCALVVPPPGLAGEPAAAEPSPGESGERYLEPLARGLARALGSDGFRQDLFEELRSSPWVEGRVALKRRLAQDPELRRELLWHADLGARWNRLSKALPELELYFPSKAHRGLWTGDLDVRVAVETETEGTFRFFAPDGTQGTFRSTDPPEVPTLLLARSEIDYDDLESALEGGARTGAALRRPAGGEAPLATLAPKNGLAVKVSGVDPSRHTYITGFLIDHDHDPWKGSMEIEIYAKIDGSYGGCQRFTGIEEFVTYYLPAAGATGSKKIAYAVPTGTNVADIEVYEDDDTGCVVKSSDDYIRYDPREIGSYGLWRNLLRVETLGTSCGDSTCEGDESKFNCCTDCASCGDGQCSPCENGSTCPADCYTCGNGFCEGSKGETQWNCPSDCGSCGNGLCESGETEFSCPLDCCNEPICPE